MSGVPITQCASCSATSFPPRIWCPACGSAELSDADGELGTIEEVTILHCAIDRSVSLPVAIGTVQLDVGATVVARLEGVSSGERARVSFVEHAVVARPA